MTREVIIVTADTFLYCKENNHRRSQVLLTVEVRDNTTVLRPPGAYVFRVEFIYKLKQLRKDI